MVQSSGQGLTQKGFASRWAYLTIVNPRKALEHMMYLGLPMDPAFMQRHFAISKTRQQERRRGKDFQGRALFQVWYRYSYFRHGIHTCVILLQRLKYIRYGLDS